jgi:hypothetical protein
MSACKVEKMWDSRKKDLSDRDCEEEVNGWIQSYVKRRILLSAVVNLQFLLRSWGDGHLASLSCLFTSEKQSVVPFSQEAGYSGDDVNS